MFFDFFRKKSPPPPPTNLTDIRVSFNVSRKKNYYNVIFFGKFVSIYRAHLVNNTEISDKKIKKQFKCFDAQNIKVGSVPATYICQKDYICNLTLDGKSFRPTFSILNPNPQIVNPLKIFDQPTVPSLEKTFFNIFCKK